MTERLEGVVDPERDFPRRPLMTNRRRQRWIEEHNPHRPGTWEHLDWVLRFNLDQTSAMMDPLRSRMAFAMRYVLLPLCIGMSLISIVILIVRLATGSPE